VSLPRGFALPATLPAAPLEDALALRICASATAASEPAFRRTARYRFDDPAGGFSTLYCAPAFATCFLETLVRDAAALTVQRAAYDATSLALLLLDAEHLRLVDLFSTRGVTRLRIDLATLTSDRYADTQRLGRMIHDHPEQPHGILYRSRFDPDRPAIVLFARAGAHVRLFPGTSPGPLADAPELAAGLRNQAPFTLL
jgi:hypothetical protein